MKGIFTFGLIMFFNFSALMAQGVDIAFKVLATRGVNKVNSASGGGIKVLKAGNAITSNAKLTVAANGMVGLIYKNGRTLEIKTAGDYAVSSLVKQVLEKSSSSVNTQYAKYVLAQITKGNDEPVSMSPGRNMGVTGAVTRGMRNSMVKEIPVYVPGTEILSGTSPTIYWGGIAGAPGYLVRIFDRRSNIILSMESKDTMAIIDFSKLYLLPAEDTVCVLQIEAKDKPNHSAMIPLIINKKESDFRVEYSDLLVHLDKSSATDWIAMALFCQRYNLNVDAYHAFRMAVQIAPEVPEYVGMFNEFIAQVKLKETVKSR